MDFIIGMLLIIIVIFIIINFTTISITDTNYQQNQYYNQYPNQNQNFLYSSNNRYNTPLPINANASLVLNKKLNLEEQSYDYKQSFFV
jgi:hypothetical protein